MSLAETREYDHGRWRDVAASAGARIETRLFIDGEYVDAAEGGRFVTTDPSNDETLAEMSAGTGTDIDRAVA
ncbi:MAG: aldehyde dehydrogenase PuuC, partial [Gammaproteobacteria bacterium]